MRKAGNIRNVDKNFLELLLDPFSPFFDIPTPSSFVLMSQARDWVIVGIRYLITYHFIYANFYLLNLFRRFLAATDPVATHTPTADD